MKRIRLRVAYDGTNYSGWQIQPNAPTIEKKLDEAIYALTGENVHVTGASRTDAGVHALGNVAVFDTASNIPADKFTYALNRYLPEDIIIQQSDEVESDFHPRHCDTEKTYEYTLINSQFPVPIYADYAWHVPYRLDIEKMRKAVPTWTNLPVSSTRQRIRSSRYTTSSPPSTNHSRRRAMIPSIRSWATFSPRILPTSPTTTMLAA